MASVINSPLNYVFKKVSKLSDSKMTVAALDTLSRYVSPINPAVFPHLTLVLLGIGLFFTAWFFVYEVVRSLKSFFADLLCFKVTSTKFTRELTKELVISGVASLFMGFGTLFLLLWVGIYV